MRMMSHRFATRGSQPMTDTTPNTGLQFRTDVEEDYGTVTDWATDFDLMDPDYVVHPAQRWSEQRNGGCPIAFTERRQRTWLPVRYEDLSAIPHETARSSPRAPVVVSPVSPYLQDHLPISPTRHPQNLAQDKRES